jgi:asparagine synthetase B (glutamine-hydrolysing)
MIGKITKALGAIFGIFGEADPSEMQRMSGRLEHRGEASETWSLAPRVHLGGRWAADASGSMPAPAATLALAGSIDNGESVATLLRRPRQPEGDDDDASLVLDLYQKFGPEGFQHLSGPFALALWDERRERLILARTARGSRPLYVARAGDRYLFASEYKAPRHRRAPGAAQSRRHPASAVHEARDARRLLPGGRAGGPAWIVDRTRR